MRKIVIHVVCFIAVFLFLFESSLADDYIYYRNFVNNASGESCEKTPPDVSFTVYINRDQTRILTEKAPRWEQNTEGNIDGKGTFGIELGNFRDPSVQVGDSVFVRFTEKINKQQNVLKDQIFSIPWYRFPKTLQLKGRNIPDPPNNIQLRIDNQNRRILSWDKESNLVYDIYRRSLEDTIFSGEARYMYTRLCQDLADSVYIDSMSTEDSTFAYIIYAKSSDGIYSSHSPEIMEMEHIPNLTITPQKTTAILNWESLETPGESILGYNIYRRTDDGFFYTPIAFTDTVSSYIDSRLQPNTTYHYKIRGRTVEGKEQGETAQIAVKTLSFQQKYYTYTNVKIAVVIYQNTNRGNILNTEISNIKTMLNVGRLFYWRNSGMKLNLAFHYYPVKEYKEINDPNSLAIDQTIHDLKVRGVVNTQYDLIFRITPATNGYWSIGVSNLGLPGPKRDTGFSQSAWPVGTGVVYPGHKPGINYGLTWTFIHEAQHAIDDMYYENDHPEMQHGDLPWTFPVACGEHLDFQAKILRTFEAYTDLKKDWCDIYETRDADNDKFPDDEPLVPLDEKRFGSSDQKEDTDLDGYSDRQEVLDGSYRGTDPTDIDTDSDGISDGEDTHPRYPVKPLIHQYTPVIDGHIEEGWPMVHDTVSYTQSGYSPKLYLSYDHKYFYLGLDLPRYSLPQLSFDFHDDGWWFSSGNTKMEINPLDGTLNWLRTWDARDEAQNLSTSGAGMWDDRSDYLQHFGNRVINPDSVTLAVVQNNPMIQIEMAIPKNDDAEITLEKGDSLGINIYFKNINHEPDLWATLFDQYSFVHFAFGGTVGIEAEKPECVVSQYYLGKNYPNPFNFQTQIRYQLPKQSNVKLTIFDLLGRKIKTLVNDKQTAGTYKIIWDGTDDNQMVVSSGIYFYQLKTAQYVQTRKMILLE